MKLHHHLPNLLTCGNLVCGCIGILMVPYFPIEVAAYFVWAACLFDFFDGFAARLLMVSSPIGKELDSLADMVSFGVLPTLVMYSLLNSTRPAFPISYVALLLVLFSALRLAKFNVDETQKDSFTGLPTPANALFITALVFLPAPLHEAIHNTWTLVLITVVFSFLLIAPLELFALKFKNFAWPDNSVRFIFIALSTALILLLRAGSVPLIILLYITVSLVNRALKVQKN
jgi:CDP-diacylglycerol--serine O-phosphatidyltransferase